MDKYNIVLHKDGKEYYLSPLSTLNNGEAFEIDETKVVSSVKTIDSKTVLYELTASGKGKCYFSLHGKSDGKFMCFNGECNEERLIRQSPHDYKQYVFKMDGAAMPVIADIQDNSSTIFISDNPSHVDNYTTQHIIPERDEFYLSSGDPGGSPNFESSKEFKPYYHNLEEKDHTFRFIKIDSDASSFKGIRRECYVGVQKTWGDGDDSSLYKAISFASNYMHLRKNESGTSELWIVPGIEYANCEYVRDAFWQSYILPSYEMEQCYKAPKTSILNAEYPLFYIIWSYRVMKAGGEYDKEKFELSLSTVLKCMKKIEDGRYCPLSQPDGSYRNWYDICNYEFDDCDSYSQSLCVCALKAAKLMGYDVGDNYEKAIKYYHTLFNGEFVKLSLKKPYQALDFALGDLLMYILFDETFIDDEIVCKTYRHILNSKACTPYGIKITSDANGDYLPLEAYSAYGVVNPQIARLDLGRYANGGSYHIYEMLFHIEGYLHGCKEALDNMINRMMIDLNFDGATHEYIHTIKGNGVKANQGWNAVVYAFWNELCKRGRGDKRFFDETNKKLEEFNR